ncbi:sigma-54 interaction domain-containing protein [Sanyastnella coralliicola]|uniref:sigma-54 interaction domain-containing protein n=1 Tax=Sanyastnella coralliicola TaxID=3069118 RepID=UPI0027B9F89C|nr:sigma-54 dependent transcriptional regulator [Longitalea sp. SCSIO 12813]
MEIQSVKQRFGIIGNSTPLNRAIDIAVQVAPTNISVLINGESGTGKEVMPKIIHNLSSRKHGPYIAVNCGAIPEGTIDSELFGHEKGAFTGAHDSRKGYFEVANGGTIFLDEVAELPLQTQVRLLRVLETGEFIKVGSSKVIKTDVRVVAATNVNFGDAISKGRFREDLYYRLNQVPIFMPPLRDRKEDIHLLFRKFTTDFSEQYRMPPLGLDHDAVEILINYRWPGNVRQLKNITEQMSVIEKERDIDAQTLLQYLPVDEVNHLPMVVDKQQQESQNYSEREILYQLLFDMKNDLTDLKKLVLQMIQHDGHLDPTESNVALMKRVFEDDAQTENMSPAASSGVLHLPQRAATPSYEEHHVHEEVEETFSLQETEKELIKKALAKHKNKRKYAARELGISERTLYRKIKEYNL